MRVPRAPLLLLFVLSGAAGLIYEVVWARQLVLVFGNTSQAVSTILTGFFGGLAIGGFVGGRIADRVARPLRMYGVLELDPGRDRRPHAAELPPHRRGVPRASTRRSSETPIALALVRFAARDPRPRARDRADGRDAADADALPVDGQRRASAGAFQQLYAANTIGAIVGHGDRGLRADRAARAHGRAARRRGVLGDRRRRRAAARSAGGAARREPRRPPRSPPPRRRRCGRARRRPGCRAVAVADAAARPPPARADARVRLGPHVARLPGGLEPAPRRRDRQLDLRVHDHPGAVPDRHRDRRRSCSASSGRASARSSA